MLRRLALCALALVPLAFAPAQAQDTRLQALTTLDAGRGWQAVGRLDLAGEGGEQRAFCTATLIAPDRVLTAAHCLYHRPSGTRIDLSQITFLAGWRSGRAEAIRGIRRVAIEPDFRFTTGGALDRVASDLALLELDQPIRLPSIRPFPVAANTPAAGSPVAVVSYARERSETPALQESCTLLDRRANRVLVMSCDIDFGASGAPVFVSGPDGAQIVSVISAMAETAARKVALGMQIEGRINTLEAMLTGPVGARNTARFIRP